MIMFELASRRLPFYDNDWTAFRVQAEVLGGARPALPPTVAPPDGFVALMEACWAGNSRDRPNFGQILAALGNIDASTGGDACVPSDGRDIASTLSDATQSCSL